MERLITKQEEKAVKLCHHDFRGLTTAKAAIKMGISQRRVQQLLQNVSLKAPQLFPILTLRQIQIRDYINENGFTFEQIAKELDVSICTVSGWVETLKKKGVCLERRKPTVHYENWMDDKIVRKI